LSSLGAILRIGAPDAGTICFGTRRLGRSFACTPIRVGNGGSEMRFQMTVHQVSGFRRATACSGSQNRGERGNK